MVRCLRSILFVLENRSKLLAAVTRFAKQVNSPAASKVDKEKYLRICEVLGEKPNPEAMPLEMSDFPPIISLAFTIFNSLRDTFMPTEIPVYTGKDLAGLPVLLDIYEVTEPSDKQLLLQVINVLDAQAVAASRAELAKRAKTKPRVASAQPGALVK